MRSFWMVPIAAGLSLAACDDAGPAGPGETPPPVSSVSVAPDTATLVVGQTLGLQASVRGPDGEVLPDRRVAWTSSDTSVLKVDSTGRVAARSEGSAVVTATSEGRSGEATVRVEAASLPGPTVASVEVRPSVVVTYVGQSVRLAATLRAADGTVLTGRPVAWTTSDPAVAAFEAPGMVRGVGLGEAVVTASSGGKSATVAMSFRMGSTHHLAFDRETPAFVKMDMRTGSVQDALEHAAGIRSRDPSPSPDRTGIAYVHDSGGDAAPWIAIQDWTGSTYRFLTPGDQPAWSPDGSRIAFRGTAGGRADVWVIAADGSGDPVNLTADLPDGTESERPAWSPDGMRVVFAASNPRGGSDLWITSADGVDKRRLTSGPVRDTEPTWHGERIVFTRRTAQGTSDLYWLYVNGALVRRLTTAGGAQMPAWAPDGRWIAFVVRDGESGVGDVMVVRPDGSDVRPLSLRSDGPGGGGLNPAWTLHW